DRLTRAMMFGINNFRPWHMRVRDVVGDLLDGLAAEELMRGADGQDVGGGWLSRLQGYPVTKAGASQWWEKAKKVGEERHLLDKLLPDDMSNRTPRMPSGHLLHVILTKSPKQIPKPSGEIVERRPTVESWMFQTAVLRGELPTKEKLSVLL